ncbi:unnamed protein product [Bursaphelenchus okinawaensis]|uniref:Uncharacterized protein n=1 Tax=Bursaphelenchus okinawaensis TaxID=465554 RepID=A0A811L561_9BILA|nr:unnamed protein product [Bursaphelenchus okinawaensis]CAG9119801.1 unnamed protein product [Bursaphelenchus okinawaensis]
MDYFRGWVAITMIQQLGILVRISVDSESLQIAFFKSTISRKAARPYVSLFLVFTIQQLMLKLALQFDIKNKTLNFIHVVFSIVTLVFFVLETFLYQYFELTNSSMIQMGFNLISVIFTLIMWPKLKEEESVEEHRPRRVIAKHFMETQVRGFNTTDVPQEPKKTK